MNKNKRYDERTLNYLFGSKTKALYNAPWASLLLKICTFEYIRSHQGQVFLFQHIAETNLAIAANAFGAPMAFKPQTLMGAKDEGQISDKAQIETLLQQAGKTIEDIISQASDQDLQTEVDTVLGKMTKWQVIGFLMHHSSHHHGQIAQALKRGFNPQAA
ncbi:MAG TPA: hypothetical protein DCM08_00005, partial [Microscillaceae bacterium]|jgi:uncharacterized damage-inducible protein DinB|nr:hypothetical protein [Microscillaceae bacterium]